MNRDTTVAGLIDAAAQAVRVANHRALDPGHHSVPEVYRILGELSVLGHRLPQLCDQLAATLRRRNDLGRLRLDEDGQRRGYHHPSDAIDQAVQALALAALNAHQFAAGVDAAQNACGPIADTAGLDDAPDDDGLQQ